jgi:hypothetical protein
MGLILVAVGLLMLISLITQVDMFITMMTLWPVIMICLGIEILLFLFLKKGNDTKIRYDVLSIFFIGFILSISVLFYAATSFMGMLFDSREDMFDVFGIFSENIYTKNTVELEGTDELVVLDRVNSLRILPAAGGNIRVDYNVSVSATPNGRTYAEAYVDSIIKFEKGERAYMLPNLHMFNHNRYIGYPLVSCIIYLPQGKNLDVSRYYGQLSYDDELEEQIIFKHYELYYEH